MVIGFVGLGKMGFAMLTALADRIQAKIIAFDRNPATLERLSTLASYGRTLSAGRNPDALSACDIVIIMLPDSAVTCGVIEGRDGALGLAQILRSGATIIDMGSSDPLQTQRLAPVLQAVGIRFADAPVSGAVAKAQSATLTIMVGGDNATFTRIEPILRCMGSSVIRTGAIGSAHAMKALNNYVYAAGLLAVCEALAIAERMQLDPAIFADVLNASSGQNIASASKLRQFIIPRNFNGGFSLALQAKDLATAARLQSVTGVEAHQLRLCTLFWQQALAHSLPDADNTEIFQHIENAELCQRSLFSKV